MPTQNRVCSWEYASGRPRADAAGVELDIPGDAALHGRTGVIEVEPARDEADPLYRHGPLRRTSAGARHLQHADRTPFLWLADTW